MIDLDEFDRRVEWLDEIVEADRAVGQEIFRKAGGTVRAYFEYVRRLAESAPNPKYYDFAELKPTVDLTHEKTNP
ncbi:MAG: hypothetical protein HYV26_18970 [Candidatus Hydrogenedentes bacterium]|nr:hypothetical protein [Candidatus Hydrogenedentota bacterium]